MKTRGNGLRNSDEIVAGSLAGEENLARTGDGAEAASRMSTAPTVCECSRYDLKTKMGSRSARSLKRRDGGFLWIMSKSRATDASTPSHENPTREMLE